MPSVLDFACGLSEDFMVDLLSPTFLVRLLVFEQLALEIQLICLDLIHDKHEVGTKTVLTR